MEEKSTKNNFKPLVIILSIIAVIAVCIVAFAVIYPMISKNNPDVNANNTTAQATEEKFVTDIEFEYFDDPLALVEYIEDCVDFEIIPEDHNYDITMRPITADYYVVPPEEHDKIASYVANVYVKLTDEEIERLEKQIAKDERFVEYLGDLKILIDSPGGDNLYEYKMVYNMDTKEYNTMPDKAGEYSLITVFYDADDHGFTIERFNNKYWKLENRYN